MAYDTTEAVAKFLSGFQMKITNREKDTGKGGGGISLSGEAKDMMAASKQLAGASAAPSREHLVAKPDLSR